MGLLKKSVVTKDHFIDLLNKEEAEFKGNGSIKGRPVTVYILAVTGIYLAASRQSDGKVLMEFYSDKESCGCD